VGFVPHTLTPSTQINQNITMRMYSPDGYIIVGTLESLQGCATINRDSFKEEGDGFAFDYSGTTEVWWNAQKTITQDGERLFVDENGEAWKESELIPRD
jgi:hypothetical protein